MSNFLTNIELQGFKSFADKTEFKINERVIAVVGPNGSGKSNIIDALRWVMGEREAKNLRGEVLGSLIFAGTPKRGSSSLARVTLRFDNSKGLLPIDSNEVSLSRKIDKSGTSQFFINDEEVRLKDLIPVLAKARLGHRGLTIIGQGQSDMFVSISSEERRIMIEEILGLKEFRLKKKTAENRLRRSLTNMEKLEAKVEEIKPHLRFLRKQKNKWEKRSIIEEELKNISENYFSHHYHNFLNDLNNLEKESKELQNQIEEKEKEIKKLSSEVSEINKKQEGLSDLGKIRKEVDILNDQLSNLERDLTKLEVRKEFVSNQSPNQKSHSSSHLLNLIETFLKEIKPKISNDNEEVKPLLSSWIEKFEKLFNQEEEIKNEESNDQDEEQIEKIKDEINTFKEKIKSLREKEESILSSQEEDNKKFRDKVETLEKIKNRSRELEQKLNKISLEKEKVSFKKKELENKWTSLGFSLASLENIEKKDNFDSTDWDRQENKIDRLRSELNTIGDIDKSLIEEANETEKRYEFLNKELEDLRQASDNLKKLISDLEKRIHKDFKKDFNLVNKEFNNYFRLMFGGGKARMKLEKKENNQNSNTEDDSSSEEKDEELQAGVDIQLKLPGKKINSLDMLSGGEKTLVSLASLFALISVSPPPFLVLDEIDAALDDSNTSRFAELIKEFSHKTQFIIVTHNRVTMESVDALYGVTMGDDGVSKVLSLKFEEAEEIAQ